LQRARAANGALGWMEALKNDALIHQVKDMVHATTGSILRSGLALVPMTKEDHERANTVRAACAKRLLGLPAQSHPKLVLAELGWESSSMSDAKEKAGLYYRLSQKKAGPQVAAVILRRKEDVERGEKQGVTPAILAHLQGMNVDEVWEEPERMGKKDDWKTRVKEAAEATHEIEFTKWIKTRPKEAPERCIERNFGEKEYVGWAKKDRKGLALKMAIRIGSANLKGNEIGKKAAEQMKVPNRNREETYACRLCRAHHGESHHPPARETELHLVAECTEMWMEYRPMFKIADKAYGPGWRKRGANRKKKISQDPNRERNEQGQQEKVGRVCEGHSQSSGCNARTHGGKVATLRPVGKVSVPHTRTR
jgi:hypothetical protein